MDTNCRPVRPARIIASRTFQSKVIPHPAKLREWPIWARALKEFAKEEDIGIGDVVHRMIGEETSAAFEAWYLATFGKPCKCKGRQARWNKLYPLTSCARQ